VRILKKEWIDACIGQKSLVTDSNFELKRNDSGKIPSSIDPENFYE
jgi:hypothetical protein